MEVVSWKAALSHYLPTLWKCNSSNQHETSFPSYRLPGLCLWFQPFLFPFSSLRFSSLPLSFLFSYSLVWLVYFASNLIYTCILSPFPSIYFPFTAFTMGANKIAPRATRSQLSMGLPIDMAGKVYQKFFSLEVQLFFFETTMVLNFFLNFLFLDSICCWCCWFHWLWFCYCQSLCWSW